MTDGWYQWPQAIELKHRHLFVWEREREREKRHFSCFTSSTTSVDAVRRYEFLIWFLLQWKSNPVERNMSKKMITYWKEQKKSTTKPQNSFFAVEILAFVYSISCAGSFDSEYSTRQMWHQDRHLANEQANSLSWAFVVGDICWKNKLKDMH